MEEQNLKSVGLSAAVAWVTPLCRSPNRESAFATRAGWIPPNWKFSFFLLLAKLREICCKFISIFRERLEAVLEIQHLQLTPQKVESTCRYLRHCGDGRDACFASLEILSHESSEMAAESAAAGVPKCKNQTHWFLRVNMAWPISTGNGKGPNSILQSKDEVLCQILFWGRLRVTKPVKGLLMGWRIMK